MNILQIQSRITKLWFLLVFIPLLVGLVSYSTISKKTNYRASISLGLSLNNSEFTKVSSENYDRQLNSLSEYLSNRLKSIEVQKLIIQKLGESDKLIDAKKPIYEINNSTSGFVNANGVFDSKEKADKFLDAIKSAYKTVILTEKSQNELINYQIKPMDNFLEAVIEQQPSTQLQLLPSIISLVAVFLLILIIPHNSQN